MASATLPFLITHGIITTSPKQERTHDHPNPTPHPTERTMRRIAEFKIKDNHLDCTIEEYIQRAKDHQANKTPAQNTRITR